MRFADIAELTEDQISRVLFHPRDDKGQLDLGEQGDGFRKSVYKVWKLREPHLTDAEMNERFKKAYNIGDGDDGLDPEYRERVAAEIKEVWEQTDDWD